MLIIIVSAEIKFDCIYCYFFFHYPLSIDMVAVKSHTWKSIIMKDIFPIFDFQSLQFVYTVNLCLIIRFCIRRC